ncbi:unnamed protein product [Notodromas monacha]|uniref:Uncharacterized protein n=1 Tax=Notodromas monacha TaxID=399045 RepID=A0A7R9BWU1_9CRUS|nr:unnamed protein product [Notodromas monacha]CAG0923250.1 unnamed protein product [Notodromas monacha]
MKWTSVFASVTPPLLLLLMMVAAAGRQVDGSPVVAPADALAGTDYDFRRGAAMADERYLT